MTIGQIPASGYRKNVNQSVVAVCWLSEIEQQLVGLRFDSILASGGEARVMGRFVDGYCAAARTVYQFHGCFYHGCEACFSSDDFNEVLNEKFYILRKRTRRFTQLLRDNAYEVVEMWECDYLRERKFTQRELSEKKRSFFNILPMNPRDALFGGRTLPACLQYSVSKEGKKIKYIDVRSLYPSVQKKYDYPVMHPIVYVGVECADVDLCNVFGLLKCSVLPPRDLLFPVLSVRLNGKLLFPLCYSCARDMCDECRHVDDDRVLSGTWTSVEVMKAVECG